MQRIGQSWLVLEITHSPEALGIVTALQFFPILMLSLFAGVWVDRMPKHRLLVVTQTAALVQALLLAIPTMMGTIQLWQVDVLAFTLGIISALDNPARQSFVMEMVGRENIVNAVALNSAQFNGSRLLGPAIGGLLIAAWGVGVCFLFNAVSFLAVLVGLLMMRTDQFINVPAYGPRAEPMLAQLREGLHFVFTRVELAVAVIVAALFHIFGFNFNILMPLMAKDAFAAGAEVFGLLMAAIGLGSVIAAFAVATIGRSSLQVMLTGAASMGLLLIATGSVPWFPAALLLLVGAGYSSMLVTSSTNTLLQLSSPDRLRGRVMSLYSLVFAGTAPFGALIAGFMASALRVRLTLVIDGALCVLVPLIALAYMRTRESATALPAAA
jgi:MFS family permease